MFFKILFLVVVKFVDPISSTAESFWRRLYTAFQWIKHPYIESTTVLSDTKHA